MNKHLRPDIKKAVSASYSSFERTKYRVFSKPLFDLSQNNSSLNPEIGFIYSTNSLKNWIKKLTAGLIYDGLQYFDKKIDWETVECWSPDFLSEINHTDSNKYQTLLLNNKLRDWIDDTKWFEGWSSYPRKYPFSIYHFYFSFNYEEVIFKHQFYKNYSWYVWIKKYDGIQNKLLAKINT